MSDKPKIPRPLALTVAGQICECLEPFCEKLEVAGSIRRQRPTVGDIEILFIPKLAPDRRTLFTALLGGEVEMIDLAAKVLDSLLLDGYLTKRLNSNGSAMWGDKNKLAVHYASGIPVDFFSTTPENWFVSLVIRTGGKLTNIALASAAKRQGLKLHPYGDGFTNRRTGQRIHCASEKDVFRVAGVPYREPKDRA